MGRVQSNIDRLERKLCRLELKLGKTSVRKKFRHDYQIWKERFELPEGENRRSVKKELRKWQRMPFVSIILRVHTFEEQLVRQTLNSVFRQWYENWEVIITAGDCFHSALTKLYSECDASSAKIALLFTSENDKPLDQFNAALIQANGEWIIELSPGDTFSSHSLFCFMSAANANTSVALLYSDEDRVDRSWRYFDPFFKCAWNASYFYSVDLLGRACLFKKDILTSIGGYRSDVQGAERFDLALRYIERINQKHIIHIPRVLIHRFSEQFNQACAQVPVFQYSPKAAYVLEDHLRRTGVEADVLAEKYGLRIRYTLPEVPPLVSLIIPTRNSHALVRQCIESILLNTTYPNYEIILVDNGSDEPESLKYFLQLSESDRISIVRDDREFNYSALNNSAVRIAKGEIIALINNDIEVISPGWLYEMVSIAVQPKVGAVGAKLLYPDGRLQHGGVLLGVGGVANHAHRLIDRDDAGYGNRAAVVSEFSAVTAACLVVRKPLFEAVDGLNEKELGVAFNDVDFCLRLKAFGYCNVWTPFAELYHHESATRGYDKSQEKKKRLASETDYMWRIWGELLSEDPCYNPNLSSQKEDFSLAWPPSSVPRK